MMTAIWKSRRAAKSGSQRHFLSGARKGDDRVAHCCRVAGCRCLLCPCRNSEIHERDDASNSRSRRAYRHGMCLRRREPVDTRCVLAQMAGVRGRIRRRPCARSGDLVHQISERVRAILTTPRLGCSDPASKLLTGLRSAFRLRDAVGLWRARRLGSARKRTLELMCNDECAKNDG
jgi:hypothetical protein